MTENYKKPLPENTSLCVYRDNKLFFSSKGKWLHPLFELADFITSSGDQNIKDSELSAHDTYIGKAAAVLMIRFGITKIHANTASKLASDYIEELNKKGAQISFSYEKLIERLLCKTEEELENLSDPDQMYALLKARHDKSLGL